MESFGLYLLKSAVWLAGFSLVFLVVLRNERYFRLNRIYMLSGIFASILFPLYTWHYAVILPSVQVAYTTTPELSDVTIAPPPTAIPIYWWFYLVGMVGIALRLTWQTGMVVRKLRKTGYVKTGSVKLVRTSEYDGSFSFFSFVFVNPSITDIETKEIVNHEREHIHQRHWFDLLLVELLCILQWFNPFVWIYARLIRQNHEYLADEMALQRTSNPAIYQATLLNQLLGAPVISLANSFNYSLNKKRFKMMKKNRHSPLRKLKMLLVLPLVAMVFYAFAKPEYITSEPATSADKMTTIAEALNELSVPMNVPADKPGKIVQDEQVKFVTGKVVNPDGKPLRGTAVVIKGTTIGTITDKNGEFKLKDVPKDGELVFSYVGLETKVIKPDFDKPMTVNMISKTFGIEKVVVVGYGNTNGPPPPPPPPPPTRIKTDSIDSKNPPLYVVDGVITDKRRAEYFLEVGVESVNVLKGKSATDKYGEKGKYGVWEMTLKKDAKGGATTDSLTQQGISLKANSVTINTNSEKSPLVFLDGIIIDKAKMDAINPNDIESITVSKDKSAVEKYGDKGKNGVILITSKKKGIQNKLAGGTKTISSLSGDTVSQKKNSAVFVVVEQMPEFPGGVNELRKFIASQIKYPVEAQKLSVQGNVFVTFVVNSNGKVENAKIVRGVNPALDAEAIRVVNSLPDWKPGQQQGVAVDVAYTMPIEFKLQ